MGRKGERWEKVRSKIRGQGCVGLETTGITELGLSKLYLKQNL